MQFDDPDGVDQLLLPTGSEESFTVLTDFDFSHTPLYLSCSSGTTGNVKIAMISHGYTSSRAMRTVLSGQKRFMVCPLMWINGTWLMIDGVLQGFCNVITDQPYSAELFAKIITTYKITTLFSFQHQAYDFLKYLETNDVDLNSIVRYSCGGTLIHEETKNKIDQVLPNGRFVSVYGMTETKVLTADFACSRKPKSVGQPVLGDKFKVIDEDGRRLGIMESGELCVKLPYPFLGHLGLPSPFDQEGFYPTGDLGYFDEDGYLYIEGRSKDLIRYLGNMIYGSALEEVIAAKTGIRELCVVGYPVPEFRELATAVVVKPPGSKITEADIVKIVEKNCPDYQKLRGGVYFVEKLPRTLSGKIKRFEVLKLLKQLKGEI